MIIYEFKVKGKDRQYRAIDDAIRTSQFIQNKCLRQWMDIKGLSKYDLNKYCAVLADSFPFANELNSMARQSAAERAWSAISRFYDNCKKKTKGKKGFPKFKKHCRSVEYKTTGWKLSITRKAITFSDKKGIGTLKLKGTYDLNHYDIKQIKRVRLVRRADGYCAQFAISVDQKVETQPTGQVLGIDLGLKYFIADNKGNVEPSPQFYRKSEKQLNRANRKKSKKYDLSKKKDKKPQSSNYHKARNRYARKHLRVSRQRKEYCKRLAYSVIQSNDLVAYEDLNVKGMARNRHLAKSIVEIPSTDTSAYCQARSRLPEALLQKLFYHSGKNLEQKVTTEYLWCGRNVKVIDGSTVSMPDTLENQEAYPQPSTQASGCGFPIAKIGVIFSLATGAAIAICIDVLNTHDIKLARNLYQFLNPLDILLGDRAFCAYADLISIKNLNCDAVFRKHQTRKTTMRKGKIIGSSDKLVTWYKPKKCPRGLSKDEFDALPLTVTVREIFYYIVIPGFRTERVSLITTLLDTITYSTLDIVGLYGQRWDVELDLRHLKTTLGMDVLRCKTPSMIRKEIYVYLLAYNLLRSLMWSAGTTYGNPPLRLSLQGTRHHLNNFIPKLLAATSTKRLQIYWTLLKVIAHKAVSDRPGRSEPRVRKRRPKAYPLMTKPRHELQKQLQTA